MAQGVPPFEKRNDLTYFGPIGRCVYCGAERYREGGGWLHEEHIIPLALEGQLILSEASCQRHEQITNSFEQPILRSVGLRAFRHQAGLRRRNKESAPKTLPIFEVNGVAGSRMDIPLDDYPAVPFLPIYPVPTLIRENLPSPNLQGVWHVSHKDKLEKFRDKYQIRSFRGPYFPGDLFPRMLAKIGHCYLVAKLGLDNFKPLLLEIIEGTSNDFAPYIGGPGSGDFGAQPGLWYLQPTVSKIGDVSYAVIELRLFGRLSGPFYFIVAGKVNPDVRLIVLRREHWSSGFPRV